jgi:hypothetical protein
VIKGGGSVATALAEAGSQAGKAFKANAGSVAFAAVPTLTLPITSKSGQTLTASISYSTQAQTNFSRILGISNVAIRGTSTSSAAIKSTLYMNIYVIVDISQSMGIAANPADMQLLYDRVAKAGNGSDGEVGCVFGCHVAATNQATTNEKLAHYGGQWINLRIDSAVTAIQRIITEAETMPVGSGKIQIGIYTMSEDPTNGNLLNVISSPSSDYTTLSAEAATIDLGNNKPDGIGDSDMTDSLTQFYNNVLASAPSGDGSSPSSPLNYVYIITDGVQDTPGASCISGHCVSLLDTTPCAKLRSKATVDVIYTTYLPLFAGNVAPSGPAPYPPSAYETNYFQLVYPIANGIEPNLQACASKPSKSAPTTFYEAADDTTLINDLTALFISTTQIARITQ